MRARRGFIRAAGLAATPGTENLSQSSDAGSALGVSWPGAPLARLGTGALAAGEDTGDELLAHRFRPRRVSIGDMAALDGSMASLSHTILSLGESTSSSLAGCLPPSRSCHVGRPAGVLATAAPGGPFSPFCEAEAAALFLFGSVGSAVAAAASLGAFGGGGSNWKAWSLFRAESDTGPKAGEGFAVGLLFVLFHCARFRVSAFFFLIGGRGPFDSPCCSSGVWCCPSRTSLAGACSPNCPRAARQVLHCPTCARSKIID